MEAVFDNRRKNQRAIILRADRASPIEPEFPEQYKNVTHGRYTYSFGKAVIC